MRYIIPLLSLFLLISCKSFDNRLFDQKEYLDNSVVPMKIVINQSSIDKSIHFKDFPAYVYITDEEVTRIINQQLIFEQKPGKIYLSVIVRKTNIDIFSHLYQMLFLMVPVLLGAPMDTMTFTIKLDAAIIKQDGRILKTYTSTGVATDYNGGTAHYYYTSTDAPKTLYIRALQAACKDLREQLKNDSDTINRIAR